MIEIVKIELENEMDLILCHKRSMKLAELCGLSVLVQTSFATAVSEIARCVIGKNKGRSELKLGLKDVRNGRKELMVVLSTDVFFGKADDTSVKYASRLVDSLKINTKDKGSEIIISEKINFSGLLNDTRIQGFINYFKRELPLSPYDELRKKNIQLIEMAEKLQESEDQYRNLSETLPLMIFTINAAGYVKYGNQWLKDHFSLVEVQPGKLHWTSLIETRDHTLILSSWEKSQIEQGPFRSQARIRTKNGPEPLWHLISLLPILNEDGQLVEWNGFFADIHAQKLVEETLKNNVELKQAQKQLLNYQARLENNVNELNKSNHDLEQFAYIASHDLQEPLRKIRNYTELLEKNIQDREKTNRFLEKIDSASARMSSLIKGVLDYSRLTKAKIAYEQVELQKVLYNVKMDVELVIEEKKAKLSSDKLPAIIGIPQQLHQLFYNIINNALKFTESQPHIQVLCRELGHDEIKAFEGLHTSVKYIELKFKDNGIGFDQKHAEQIFTIFQRLNPKEKFEGTGIGLALCKKIVDNHHGLISAESEPGKGTTFKVILPLN